jgi:hypothetical protein
MFLWHRLAPPLDEISPLGELSLHVDALAHLDVAIDRAPQREEGYDERQYRRACLPPLIL